MLAADDLLAALRRLRDAAARGTLDQRTDHLAVLAAESARLLAAANLMRSLTPRLEKSDLGPADAAQGLTILADQLRRHGVQVGEGRGGEHPLHPQLDALRDAWRALADAAGALRDVPADDRQHALMQAELSWRRAHADVQRLQQQGFAS